MTDTEIPEAVPGEVAFTVVWTPENGSLDGELSARNICEHRLRLSGKPVLAPLGVDGRPLDVELAITTELRLPGWVELGPGERATAHVTWAGWDAPESSGRILVRWPGGEEEATVNGPRVPESRGPVTNLSSSWFERVD